MCRQGFLTAGIKINSGWFTREKKSSLKGTELFTEQSGTPDGRTKGMDRRKKGEQSASNLSWWGCAVSCRQTLDPWAPPGSFLGVAQWSTAPECCLQAHINCDWILELTVARSCSLRSPYFLARFQMNTKAQQFRRLNKDQLSVSVRTPVRSPVTGSQRGRKNERELLGAEESTG